MRSSVKLSCHFLKVVSQWVQIDVIKFVQNVFPNINKAENEAAHPWTQKIQERWLKVWSWLFCDPCKKCTVNYSLEMVKLGISRQKKMC